MDTKIYRYFADIIEKELGIMYGEDNKFQLINRLEQIAQTYGLASVSELYTKFSTGMDVAGRDKILNSATNHETSFFRDSRVFTAVEKSLIPTILVTLKPKELLRVWSAGCSHGQEPYSLSILLNEQKLKGKAHDFEITATDVSELALSKAREAKYTRFEINRGMPKELFNRYFDGDQDAEFVHAKRDLKHSVSFKTLNLLNPFESLGKFHLILCRNVLIYQKVEKKIEIIKRFTNRLLDGGYLIMGAGETLLGLSNDFDQVTIEGIVIYRLKQGK
jgi:chemotaxis protein methyltransferase CheR